MHVHVSTLDFFIIGAYFILFAYFWRLISLHFADRPLGKAMGAIF